MSISFLSAILLLFIALPATACGWLAVARIRHSEGRLHGMGLALFAGLAFPLLLLDTAIYAGIKMILAPFFQLDPAIFQLMSMVTWGLLAVLDIAIGIMLWQTLKPRKPERPTPMPSSPGQDQTSPAPGWTGLWIALFLHGAALVTTLLFFILLVPKFEHIFADMLGANLPGITTISLSIGHVFRQWGFVIILVVLPALLAIDLAICWLAQRLGGKKLLAAWALAVLLALLGFLAVSFISLILPMHQISRELDKKPVSKAPATSMPGTTAKPGNTIPFMPGFPQPKHPISSDNRIPLPSDTDVQVEIRTKRAGVNEESTLVQALTFRVAPDRDSGFILRGDVKPAGGNAYNRWTADLVDPDTGISFRHIESDFGKPMTYTVQANTRTPRTFYLRGRNLATTFNYPEENQVELLQAEDPADPTAIPFEVYAILRTGRAVGPPEFRMVSMEAAQHPFGPYQDQSWEVDRSGNTEVFSTETWLPANQEPGLSLHYDSEKGIVVLRGYDRTTVMKTDNGQWDSFSDFQTLGILQNKPHSIEQSSAAGDKGGWPQTFLFRAPDRTIGILQVVETEERPLRLKVRYKTMTSVWPAEAKIKLLAVNSQCAQAGWWKPDGFPAWLPPFENPEIGQMAGNDSAVVRYFAFDLDGIPATTPFLHLAGDSDAGPFEQFTDLDTGVAYTDKGNQFIHPRQHRCAALVPAKAKTATIRIGIPFGRWETSGMCDKGFIFSSAPRRQPSDPMAMKIENQAGKSVSLLVDMDNDNYECRIAYKTVDGRTISNTGGPSISRRSMPGGQAVYSYRWDLGDLVPLERIGSFRLLVRPYHWTVFENIALQPANVDTTPAKKQGPGTAATPIPEQKPTLSSNAPTPTFESVTAEVTRVVRKYRPEAKVENKPNFLIIACDLQEFVIHKPIGKTGPDVVGTDTYRTTGPSASGFILNVYQIAGPYRGQALAVRVMHEPYWTTFDNYVYDPKSQHSVLTGFSFGSRLDPELKKELLEILKLGSQRDFGL